MQVLHIGYEECTGDTVVIYRTPTGLVKTRPLGEWLGRVPGTGPEPQRRYELQP